tara:strand:+ start:171 stop:488 length:318 start_codon:yes stop_codon:yes gene_type:complete
MDWLKSQWASWKVKVSVVGGALVIATAYGTCEVDPGEVSDNTTGTTEEVTETVEVSATTNTGEDVTTSTTTSEEETETTTTGEAGTSTTSTSTGDGTTTTETTTE